MILKIDFRFESQNVESYVYLVCAYKHNQVIKNCEVVKVRWPEHPKLLKKKDGASYSSCKVHRT